MQAAFAGILHRARTSSDGDHKNVCGTVTSALREALAAANAQRMAAEGASLSSSTSSSRDTAIENFTSQKLIDVFLSAGKTAATAASTSSALGSAAIGSTTNIAAGAGGGFLVGAIASALFTYMFDAINDRNNMRAIASGTLTNPVQRVWVLRSMLEAGRIASISESYRKTRESLTYMQNAFSQYGRYDFSSSFPSEEALVNVTKHLFRVQKHVLRMVGMAGVLNLFYAELDMSIDRLMDSYLKEGGQADRALDLIKKQVSKRTHICAGTCYRMHEANQGGDVFSVAHRLGA
jgi:hypothetical protein